MHWQANVAGCIPNPTTVNWELADVDSTISQNLSIDPTSGLITLTPGINSGNYSYKVKATVHAKSYVPKTFTTNELPIRILKLKFGDFTIECGLPNHLEMSYTDAIPGTLSITNPPLPNGTTVTYELPSCSPGLNGKLAISGDTITLQPGVERGMYWYDIRATLNNSNYEIDTKESQFFITIDPGDNPFPTPPMLQNPWAAQSFKEYYKEATSTPITYGGLPGNLDNDALLGLQLINASGFNGYLILNSDYSLTLRYGLPVGNYNYTIRLVFGGDHEYMPCTYDFNYTISVSAIPNAVQISKNDMTSNTQNGYSAICSRNRTNNEAYKAFDGKLKASDVLGDKHHWEADWRTNDSILGVADIGQTLPSKKRMVNYTVYIVLPLDDNTHFFIPDTWIIQGSNDGGVSWTNVGQEVTHSFFDDKTSSIDVHHNFLINQGHGDGSYSSYRMHITATDDKNWVNHPKYPLCVFEIYFYGFDDN